MHISDVILFFYEKRLDCYMAEAIILRKLEIIENVTKIDRLLAYHGFHIYAKYSSWLFLWFSNVQTRYKLD